MPPEYDTTPLSTETEVLIKLDLARNEGKKGSQFFFIKFFCPIQKINISILHCSSSVSSYPILVSRNRHLLRELKMMQPTVTVSIKTKSIHFI